MTPTAENQPSPMYSHLQFFKKTFKLHLRYAVTPPAYRTWDITTEKNVYALPYDWAMRMMKNTYFSVQRSTGSSNTYSSELIPENEKYQGLHIKAAERSQ